MTTRPAPHRLGIVAILVGALLAPAAVTAAVVPSRIHLGLDPVASGLSSPLLVTHAGDDSGRLFVVEQTGRIRIIKDGSLVSAPFIDISRSVSKGGEQGLLGLAFHPSYETNGKLYLSYTDLNGTSVIREYRVSTNPDRVNGSSGRTLLRVRQPYANHNGGHLAFGPDGLLYIGLGDGGSGGDPGNRAQSRGTLLGKLLRIDVNRRTGSLPYGIPSTNPYVGRSGLDQIWAYGLRNPWRFSFDRVTGDLWIGDVGQGSWEEVDRALATRGRNAGRGLNFGWRVMEGAHCFRPSSGCVRTGRTLPLTEYGHRGGRCSITGGYVYRGNAYPDLVGAYFFGDYCTGEIWYVDRGAARGVAPTRARDTGARITSFGEDQAGELYLTDAGGTVYRLTDS
ncbi:MAG: PQQ-dependent sugar dehydrogenase [Chloroflexota bacterium]